MGSIQLAVFYALAYGAFLTEIFALVTAVRVSAASYVAAGKLTKPKWVAILGIAAALGFLTLPPAPLLGSLGFLSVAAFVAAAVYLADVRPAVRQIRGGGSEGPYGKW